MLTNPAAERIRKIALVVRGVQGFVLGVALYIWGPLFYEQLVKVIDPAAAMSLTTLLYGVESLLISLLEIPTGALGDVLGRKWSVVTSQACQMVNLILLAFVPFCHSLELVLLVGLLAVFTFALTYTFFSGSFTAWCVDSLRQCAPDLGYEQILAPVQRRYAIAQLFGAVVGISLYALGWPSAAFMVGATLALFSMVYCMGEMEDEAGQTYISTNQVSFTLIGARMGKVIGEGLQPDPDHDLCGLSDG